MTPLAPPRPGVLPMYEPDGKPLVPPAPLCGWCWCEPCRCLQLVEALLRRLPS